MNKWKVFIKREKKIQQRLFMDGLLYGNRYFIKNDKPSLCDKIKCLLFGGSPYIKRIDPTKVCIWNKPSNDEPKGKSILK